MTPEERIKRIYELEREVRYYESIISENAETDDRRRTCLYDGAIEKLYDTHRRMGEHLDELIKRGDAELVLRFDDDSDFINSERDPGPEGWF